MKSSHRNKAPLSRRGFLSITAALFASTFSIKLFAAQKKAVATACMLAPAKDSRFTAKTLATIGDNFGDYRPPGVLDGMDAWRWNENTVRLFVNHELECYAGYPWQLANGTTLRGARVSWFDIDRDTQEIRAGGNAIQEMRDRRGTIVTSARQVNESSRSSLLNWFASNKDKQCGLTSLCSAQGYRVGEFGFVDDLFFTNEEVSTAEGHPHGGSVWCLDIHTGTLWALPELGRGAWENAAAIETPDQAKADGHIALLLGDDLDAGSAPLYLWVGKKIPDGNFIERNGLTQGQLYAWASNKGDRDPQDWRGTGNQRAGTFKALITHDPDQAGEPGYDRDGYLNDNLLRTQAQELGAFMMSRPEDLHTNPQNGLQVALCSTGQGNVYPADDWGTVYLIDMQFDMLNAVLRPTATLTILHDTDDYGDHGIRSPDNIVWASDGWLYIHEDRATRLNEFGGETGREASTWRLNPSKPKEFQLVAVIDRSVVLPDGAKDGRPAKLGAWECSGIIDVSKLFTENADELWLITAVQADSIRGGPIGGQELLVEGGQLVMLKRKGERATL